MAKAKTKNNEVMVIEFPQRVKNFETALIELIKTHQVGLRAELQADRIKIGAVLNYIDLVAIAKENAEAAAKNAAK